MKEDYKFVPELIPKETAHFLSHYIVSQAKTLKGGTGFPSAEHEGTLNVADCKTDLTALSILSILKPKIESITGKKLTPTYPYYRVYFKGTDMFQHTDRPECQYSTTINLGQSDPYPIYMDSTEIHMEPGDGVVYKGCEVPHHRLEFTGTWYTQMFLHYIDGTNEGKPWNGETTPNVFLEKTENLWKELLQ